MAARRLSKELYELRRTPLLNCSAEPIAGDLLHWRATMRGQSGTPYYQGLFVLNLKFSDKYPFVAPRVTFKTKIYHCNIDLDGYICWDLLTCKWTAVLTVSKILSGIRQLLSEPIVDTPYDETVAALYRDDRERYLRIAIDWTRRYAVPRPPKR